MKKPEVDYTKFRFSKINTKEYRHLWLILGWVWYLTMYFITERCIPEARWHVVHSRVDDMIPFNEYFIIGYVSWYVLLVGSLLYFLLYDVKSFVLAQKLIIGMQVIAIATYLIWPSVQYLRPENPTGNAFLISIVKTIYRLDTPTGVCPSLHVGYSLAILCAYLHKDIKRSWKIFITLWVIIICCSVCFVKQHSFTDVWAALVLYLFLEVIGMGSFKWGDRKDAKLLKDIDSMHYVMPLMYPNRCDNEACMTIHIKLDKADEYIKNWNKNNPECPISIFDLVITAALKTIRLRPQMNRFIANKNMYQRNDITAAFTVKKEFSDEGDETLARIVSEKDDTIFTLNKKIRDQIALCKTGTDESTDAMNVIQKLPFKHFIGAVARMLDRHGWMPQAVIATDPYQCSVVLSNLGSIGMNIGYHHLMNWGTTSIFIIVGKKRRVPHYDADGNVTITREMALSITIDERISDGFYYGRTLKLLKKLVEEPELLERPLEEEVKY